MFRSILIALVFTLVTSCKYSKQVLIPEAAYSTWEFIQKHNKARKGYVGGRTFRNFEQLLPKVSGANKKLRYREWDIYPKVSGKNRGAERLVTSSEGWAYYTPDHYKSFIRLEP